MNPALITARSPFVRATPARTPVVRQRSAASPSVHAPLTVFNGAPAGYAATATAADAPYPPPPAIPRDTLTAQMEALLQQLEGHGTARCRLINGRCPQPRWSEATLNALLRALKALPAAPPAVAERQHVIREALRHITRATLAEAVLERKVAHYTRRTAAQGRPGTRTARTVTLGSGASFGVAGAADVSLTGALRGEQSRTTNEDLTITHLQAGTLAGTAAAEVGRGARFGAFAAADASSTRGTAQLDCSVRDLVQRKARQATSRSLGGSAPRRLLNRLLGRHRDHYAEACSKAEAWQSRLPFLLRAPAGAPLTFANLRPVPIAAELHSRQWQLSAGVSAGVAGASLAGSRTTTTFLADIPSRLTDPADPHAPSSTAVDRGILAALERRVRPLLDRPGSRAEVHRRMRAIRDGQPPATAIDVERQQALEQLEAAFDHLEAIVRHALVAPRQAAPVFASLARDWGVRADAASPARPEPVLIAMLDCVAWLQRSAAPDATTTDHRPLHAMAQALADRIHATLLPHDRDAVHQATHAFAPMTQRIRSTRVELELSLAAASTTAAKVRVTASLDRRKDPDPMREGTYIELGLITTLSTDLAPLLEQLPLQLPSDWRVPPLQGVAALVAGMTLPATGGVTYLIRLFRPDFQKDPTYPETARGVHLQTVRAYVTGEIGGGATVPVPVAPGVSVTLGAQYAASWQHNAYDRLHHATLSGAMVRYQSLCSASRPDAEAWAELEAAQGPDLDRLVRALATLHSVPRAEARYWLRHGTDAPGTATLDALPAAYAAGNGRAALRDLFDALVPVLKRTKKASPLIQPLQLPESQGNSRRLPHWPLASRS